MALYRHSPSISNLKQLDFFDDLVRHYYTTGKERPDLRAFIRWILKACVKSIDTGDSILDFMLDLPDWEALQTDLILETAHEASLPKFEVIQRRALPIPSGFVLD